MGEGMKSESWRDRAVCLNRPTDEFFVGEYKRTTVTELKELCSHCPVKTECRAYIDTMEGSSYKDTWGIWAGETASERIARRASAKAEVTRPCRRPLARQYYRHLNRNEIPCVPCQQWKARRDAEQVRWDQAKEMLRQGHGIRETCITLGVNHHTLKRLRAEMNSSSI